MKIAVNLRHKNKMPDLGTTEEYRKWWSWFNGGFRNSNLSPIALLSIIRKGHAYTTWHRRYCKAENFICSQHLALDLDTEDKRSSFDFLLEKPFIANYASFLHTTFTHSPETPKCRVVFILDRPIYDAEEYRTIAEALVWFWGSADKKCKDVCRRFFGAEGCDIRLLGNTLAINEANSIFVDAYREYKKEQEQKQSDIMKVLDLEDVSDELLKRVAESLLEHVYTAPDGEKHDTLNRIGYVFGGYVGGGYYTEHEVGQWLWEAISSRKIDSSVAAKNTIERAVRDGKNRPLHITVRRDNKIEYDHSKILKEPVHERVGEGEEKKSLQRALKPLFVS